MTNQLLNPNLPDPDIEDSALTETLNEKVANGKLHFFQNIPVSATGEPLEFDHRTYIERLQRAYGISAVLLSDTWSWENGSSRHTPGQAGIYVDATAIEEAHPRK